MKPVPFIKRLFWFLMLVLCGLGAAVILRSTFQFRRTGETAVSFSVETTYLDFDTPFPAVTVCESSKNANGKRLKAYMASKNLAPSLKKFYEDICYWQGEFCKSCRVCTSTPRPEHCSNDIQEMVQDYRLKCEKVLSNSTCMWGGEPFSCCERFRPIQTEYGTCFSFLTDDKSHVRYLNQRTGLKSLQFSAAIDHISVKIHSPDDVVYADTDLIDIPSTKKLEIILKAEQTVSEPSVKWLPGVVRGCLMSDERPAWAHGWPFPRYSHSACVWYCRIIAEVDQCNCTHHFEPKIEGFNSCDFEGLWCLSTRRTQITGSKCPCAMSCNEIEYIEIHRFYMSKKPQRSNNFTLTVRFAQLPTLRVKRHVIRDMLSFVVDIGGVGGVFFGASVLSVIEIVYLFCIRRDR